MKEKALLTEIIAKVNGLFDGELTEDDKLVYVNKCSKGNCWSRTHWCSRLLE